MFQKLKPIVFVGTIVMMGCATANPNVETKVADEPSATIQYLKGQMFTTSPDGATPYGPPVDVLAKRTIDPARGEIVEDTWHGKEHHKTLFRLRADTLSFDVSDEKKTFEGVVTFQSDDWLRGSVNYAIELLDQSGTITGTGTWAGDTYSTNKLFSDPTGTPRARMTERLQTITEEDFVASTPK